MKKPILIFVTLLIAGGSGFALQQFIARQTTPSPEPSPVNGVAAAKVGDLRPEFAMTDLNGQLRNIKDWDGKVVLLNFWATWCPPCLKEIPLFIETQAALAGDDFEVVGIAVDDEEVVRGFVDEMAINYPVMAGDIGAIELSRRYGNRAGGLPFTAFIDRNGTIAHMETGELDKDELAAVLGRMNIVP